MYFLLYITISQLLSVKVREALLLPPIGSSTYIAYGKRSTFILAAYSVHVTHPVKYNTTISGSFIPIGTVSESPADPFSISSGHHKGPLTSTFRGCEPTVMCLCWFEFLCHKSCCVGLHDDESNVIRAHRLAEGLWIRKARHTHNTHLYWYRREVVTTSTRKESGDQSFSGWFVPRGREASVLGLLLLSGNPI